MKPPSDTLISFAQLREVYGIPYRRQTILRMRRGGSFPEPLRLSEATVAWRCADIEAWIAACPRAEQGAPSAKSKPKTKRHRAATVRRGVVTRKKRTAESPTVA